MTRRLVNKNAPCHTGKPDVTDTARRERRGFNGPAREWRTRRDDRPVTHLSVWGERISAAARSEVEATQPMLRRMFCFSKTSFSFATMRRTGVGKLPPIERYAHRRTACLRAARRGLGPLSDYENEIRSHRRVEEGAIGWKRLAPVQIDFEVGPEKIK